MPGRSRNGRPGSAPAACSPASRPAGSRRSCPGVRRAAAGRTAGSIEFGVLVSRSLMVWKLKFGFCGFVLLPPSRPQRNPALRLCDAMIRLSFCSTLQDRPRIASTSEVGVAKPPAIVNIGMRRDGSVSSSLAGELRIERQPEIVQPVRARCDSIRRGSRMSSSNRPARTDRRRDPAGSGSADRCPDR